jgi:peroxiredoxin
MSKILEAGDSVVDFALPDYTGAQRESLDARRSGPLLYVLYKKSCPTCQYALPYLERLHRQYSARGLTVWGVAQESREDAAAFAREYGLTFPQLVDADLDVTEQHAITNVPTVYLVDSGPTVLDMVVGFVSARYNELSRRIAEMVGAAYEPIVRPEDGAPALKPG